MNYRLYLPTDSDRLKALYAEMGLAEIADLPLPEKDHCTILGVVGHNGSGKADIAIFFRLTTEAVMVVNPEMHNQAHAIKGLINPCRIGLQIKDQDLRGMRMGGIQDVHAFVPAAKPKMMEFMESLAFKPCFEDFKPFYRPIEWPKKAGK